MTPEEIHDMIDFEPLFYIMDKGLCRLMLVKKEDKYEYSGAWIDRSNKKADDLPDVYAANLGKSSLQEYVTNYEFTKSEDEAFDWLNSLDNQKPLTTEQMQNRNQNPDFHY